jgi:Ca-activated chloride channel family protein
VAEDADHPALKALFGAQRIVGLEYLMNAGLQGDALTDQLARLGYDPRQVTVDGTSAVYAENAARAARDALRPLLVSESLSYGLVCAETAFVGSRTEQGQPVQARVVVGNALPAGWSDAFLSAPMAMSAGPPVMRSMAKSVGLEARSLLGRVTARFASAQAAPLSVARDPAKGARASGTDADRMLREPTRAERGRSIAVFAGRPQWGNGQATLWDSTVESLLPDQGTIARLEVHFASEPGEVDRGLALLVYVEDMAMPRARVRLADLVRLGGERPLNLRVGPGQPVRVVLVDPNGAWADAAPEMTVRLAVA